MTDRIYLDRIAQNKKRIAIFLKKMAILGIPEWTLTIDLSLRRRSLYTTELPGRIENKGFEFFTGFFTGFILERSKAQDVAFNSLRKTIYCGTGWIYHRLRRDL